MKLKNIVKLRRFFRRFNLWLYLICLLVAVIIWCTAMYVSDPDGLKEPTADPTVICAARTGEV